MPCDTVKNPTPEYRERMAAALDRLEKALELGTVTVTVGRQGSIAFKGWTDNGGLADLCAYRKLTAKGSPALRRALVRAEAMAGRGVDQKVIASGLHSHDGGATWSRH